VSGCCCPTGSRREPSTPRITTWRELRRLGAARLGDGLAALPADARTREQVDWIAEEIIPRDQLDGISRQAGRLQLSPRRGGHRRRGHHACLPGPASCR